MIIDKELVQNTMKLAKLELSEEEIGHFTEEMKKIVEMVEQLDELKADKVPGTYHGIRKVNALRKDQAINDTEREDLLANAKTHQDGFIQVPTVIDNEGGDA